MNQVGTRFGWGTDGGDNDEKPNKGSQLLRPEAKAERENERERELTSWSWLPFRMSA